MKLFSHSAYHLIDVLRRNYNLTISQESAEGIIKHIINQDNLINKQKLSRKKKRRSNIFRLLDCYWSNTKLPDSEKDTHSASYMARYIERRYWIIPIPKMWITKINLKKP